MISMEVALSLLAFSAPITAGIIVYQPRRKGDSGERVSAREFGEMVGKVDGIIRTLNELKADFKVIQEKLL